MKSASISIRQRHVAGNVDFPTLFQQYVDMASNPLLALDLSVEETSPFADKAQVARAYDLLSELKDLTVEIVRTLSRNGTVATNQINQHGPITRSALLSS